jgi:hypothetical protein
VSLPLREAAAVNVLLRWLAGKPNGAAGRPVPDDEAIDAMDLLAQGAAYRFQVAPDGISARIVERLRAAASDGAAQAVCRALDEHSTVPWNVQGPLEEWRAIRRRVPDDVDQVHAEQSAEAGW